MGPRADGFEEIHGSFGAGTRNDGGRRLLEYCTEAHLVVMNTWFKKANKATFRSAGVETEIDFMLVQHNWPKKIRNVNVIPGELQHSLVVMDMNKLLRRRKTKQPSRKRTKSGHWKMRK